MYSRQFFHFVQVNERRAGFGTVPAAENGNPPNAFTRTKAKNQWKNIMIINNELTYGCSL
jgi:hypothetical protein